MFLIVSFRYCGQSKNSDQGWCCCSYIWNTTSICLQWKQAEGAFVTGLKSHPKISYLRIRQWIAKKQTVFFYSKHSSVFPSAVVSTHLLRSLHILFPQFWKTIEWLWETSNLIGWALNNQFENPCFRYFNGPSSDLLVLNGRPLLRLLNKAIIAYKILPSSILVNIVVSKIKFMSCF